MAIPLTDLSPLANSVAKARVPVSRFVVFCNPERERARLFSAAHRAALGCDPVLIPWTRAIRGEIPWDRIVRDDIVLRLESPGKNWIVEKELLKVGATEEDEDHGPWRKLIPIEARMIEIDPGRIWPMRTWFIGLRRVLNRMAEAAGPEARWMNQPSNVIAMFDKVATDRRVSAVGANIPKSLGILICFDDLLARMNERRKWRVFVKPCYGSSSSGVIALEICCDKMQAWTTLELVSDNGELRLYNNRRVKVYRGLKEVRSVVDAICSERCIAQVWWPKAGWRGKRFDLRVIVIGGRARHVVPRLSLTPFTNLQIGAERGNADEMRREVGDENWTRMLAECERAAKAFPGNHYCTFDVLVSPGWRKFAIAEANAFGDLLNGCLHEGKNTYSAELEAYMEINS